jgi:thiol peroxidase
MLERKDVITFKGNPLTLIGNEIKVGDKAPNFTVTANDLSTFEFNSTQGKVRIISVVPSLDTPVCDTQTRQFNAEAAQLGDIEILTISMDLPFAQTRWCGAAGIDKIKCYSDYRDANFGTSYGALIKELHLDTRAVFVIDQAGVVRYVEYVKEVTSLPQYQPAIECAKELLA